MKSHPFTGSDATNAETILNNIQLAPKDFFAETFNLIIAILNKAILKPIQTT